MVRKLLLVLALASGCKAGVCARHSDCDEGQVCSKEGLCVAGSPPSPDDPPSDTDGGVDGDAGVADTTVDAPVDAPVDGGD
jgi:hypothetical protein